MWKCCRGAPRYSFRNKIKLFASRCILYNVWRMTEDCILENLLIFAHYFYVRKTGWKVTNWQVNIEKWCVAYWYMTCVNDVWKPNRFPFFRWKTEIEIWWTITLAMPFKLKHKNNKNWIHMAFSYRMDDGKGVNYYLQDSIHETLFWIWSYVSW